MSMITVYALFGDDFKYLISSNQGSAYDTDIVFNSLTINSIFLFSLEIFLQCIADRREYEPETLKTTFIQRYYLSFYFWLDIISTVSLIFDISWVFETLTDMENSDSNDIPDSLRIISKTGRGARIGSRAGRIVRIARLLRATKMISIMQQTKINLMNVNLATQGDTMMMDEIGTPVQNNQTIRAETLNNS